MLHKPIKIAILGCRGIPNRYGGFEQFADHMGPALVERGFEVTVYNASTHPYRAAEYKGVRLLRKGDPEKILGAWSQIWYDLLCIVDLWKRDFDVVYQLGYTTSGLWQWLIPGRMEVVSNMDGMEWQRAKYKGLLKSFLKYSEKRVVRRSDYLIADAEPIKAYYDGAYTKPCEYLAYAAELFTQPEEKSLQPLQLQPWSFFLVIARMQEDNHIEMIIKGYLDSGSPHPLVIIGSTDNGYGSHLRAQYTQPSIHWLGGVFDLELLNNLRYFAALYFHGHSAGGTNPSLLEAMAASARICAHDNVFNRSVCLEGARYFANEKELSKLIAQEGDPATWTERVASCRQRIDSHYHPDILADRYAAFFHTIITK